MTPTENPNRGHSLEFFPPKTDKGRARLLDAVQSLKLLKPAFVSVTFGAGGSTRDRSYEIATDILKATELQVTPHLSCIGSTREDLSKIVTSTPHFGPHIGQIGSVGFGNLSHESP